jgi:hypothetical protein
VNYVIVFVNKKQKLVLFLFIVGLFNNINVVLKMRMILKNMKGSDHGMF